MKVITLTTLFILLFHTIVFSQFKEGFVITNNNDTIRGYIDFEGSINNSIRCTFRKEPDGAKIVYLPGDINAFRFTNSKYFITSEILIDDKPQKVYLEWLIKGKANILTYSPSSLQPRYFIVIDNDSMRELKNTSVIKEIDGYKYDISKREYVGDLKNYLKDCPQLINTLDNLTYSSNALVKVSKKYHEITCGNSDCIIFEDKNRTPVYSLGIITGYVNSRFKVRNDPVEYTIPSNDMWLGLYFKMSNLPLLSPNFSFQSGIHYFNNLYTYKYTLPQPIIEDSRVCRVHSLKIPLMLRYNFLNKGLSPILELGITSTIRFSYEFYNQFITNYITNHYNYAENDIRLFQFGFITGAGIEYLTPSNFGIDLVVDYELAPRFFGTYPADETMNMNMMVNCALFYKFSTKK